MSKPTPASITEEQCACGYLQRSADNPDCPIVFDAHLNEFNFEFSRQSRPERKSWLSFFGRGDDEKRAAKSMLRIYHCPFCGGAAPESKRALLFAAIPAEEQRRLYELVEGINSIEEALQRLGPPQQDMPLAVTVQKPEKAGEPPSVESYRQITYTHLSDVADVHLIEYPGRKFHFVLQGKYVGVSSATSTSPGR